EISLSLDMSLRVVQRTLKLYNELREVSRDPKSYQKLGRGRLLNFTACDYMLKILEHKPDFFLDEIALELMDKLGLSISLSTVHCSLKLLDIMTKKLSKVALENCETCRMAFLFEISDEPIDCLVFTDESTINTLTSYWSMGHAP
ncbi:hypothetical protein K439DRAFT_1282108, partial [Ramaria rubella]